MQFRQRDSIYNQISDRMLEALISGSWAEEERIPSIRDLAMQMQVNPNTVGRSYALLQEKELIYNRRGIGYFVASGAKNKALEMKKEEFIKDVFPDLFKTMRLIGMEPEELAYHYSEYLSAGEFDNPVVDPE